MTDSRPCRRRRRTSEPGISVSLPPEPVAIDHLRLIRQTMERSTSFTAVPGWGFVVMGCTALVASVVARWPRKVEGWLLVWLAEFLIGLTIALVTMHRKARREGTEMLSQAGRRLLMGLLPALTAGGIVSGVLALSGVPRLIPGIWLLLYGVAVMQAGAFSVRIVPVMGMVFIALGVIALASNWMWANLTLGAGFGLTHIVFGYLIARRHGG